jgi:hypothetical protein
MLAEWWRPFGIFNDVGDRLQITRQGENPSVRGDVLKSKERNDSAAV